ncbi:MAG: glycogen-binding domain-containing protein [marine benthic group bacterium]|nr:glycogen-binding domain-containing protein [Gemmatimonadota bacterium]
MDSRLQSYLDGDLPLEALPAELRAQATEWDGLLGEIRAASPAGAPPGLDTRVVAAVEASRADSRPPWLAWLLRPRMIPVPPAAVLAAAAAIVAVVSLVGLPRGGAVDDALVYVQFVVDAPAAETVHLVGDFTQWQPTVELEDVDGDGVWSGRVPLLPGVHEYMFVIDGADWVTDPNAASYQDDGFGQQNAIVAVSTLNGT